MDQTTPTAPAVKSRKPRAELVLESGLFHSRWLMAPFYVGLVLALALLLFVFAKKLFLAIPTVGSMNAEEAIMLVLSLIDMSLAGNLLLIVIFSGYENFVSKIDTANHEDRPSWMGTVDFSGLKMKLIASIVAISAISLLRAFMQLSEGQGIEERSLFWLVVIHLTFVGSGVLLALMDWLASKVDRH
ncbi:MAG: TIGR00645 family protein [Phenylobacterium sp.]|jgi:uncharacterized protein (TIGR00645 family)|nr:TIGR00645 family protein [Phenylobacterium sp.]MDZ4053793.1 TIGR00645 family protein [Phenylobacterium sp.]MDZ4320186.1 TIGR00645 family protein [Phenylobacterium sp.]